ncbi:CAMK family protein kinase [Tritrichomonas foetus]|uniref:CAMK family protein kinase n=1 Tax=Tritrichomonas foetus TaxID=1144522 RepID=A0A1J4J671_9EUKA|nr:CAMK family protein kinase [Tritrichomonas foetus]|eukprot:OHS94696.1 CAMK family protein kinase [Tritrichomonas foetus]
MSSWAALPPYIGKYNLGHTIGKGSFSLVKEGQDTDTRAKYAVKIIPKSNMSTAQELERFEREVRVILKMDHPGIIKIHDFLVDASFFYLIMELCSGDTLIKQTPPPGTINEGSSKPIFKQILEVINYIHDQGIAHRDLKLENVLIDPQGHIKLIDFGFSRFAESGQMFATPCGSPAYAAPEVIGGSQYDGKAADMWSCGVLLFCLVTGELPWKQGNQVHVMTQIQKGSFEMPEGLSTFCADLISKLLQPDPLMRLTAVEAIKHPWIEGIEVSWEMNKGITPVISEKSFVKILTSSGNNFATTSPRSMLKMLGTRQNKKPPQSGSMSFGPKTPAPMPHSMIKLAGPIVPMKRDVLRPP